MSCYNFYIDYTQSGIFIEITARENLFSLEMPLNYFSSTTCVKSQCRFKHTKTLQNGI